MSLRTKQQDAKAAARAGAKNARQQAQAGAKSARRQARRATTQVTPLARSARETAQQSVHDARVWAAPRVERSGHALQERVAPKVSDMLVATARRLEPAKPVRRRRWPQAVAGIIMLGVGTAVAAVLRSRRGSASLTSQDDSGPAMTSTPGPSASGPAADTETADVNGQVRTP